MQLLFSLCFVGLLALSSSTNIPTAVVQLSDRFLEVKDEGYWFVKLYAPWCAHCKRMAPVWEHVGHSLADKNPLIRVSSMDCTLYPKACQELGVTGYPTLMFFRNGQVLQYEGEREKEAMVEYAIKAAAPLVTPIQTLTQYNEIKSLSVREPVFLRVSPPEGDETGEGSVAEAYKNAASDLLSKSRFYSISSTIASQGFKEGGVYVLRDVGVEQFDGDAASLLSWAYGERLPLLPKASGATLPHLALSEKLIVLVVANQVDRFTAGHPVGALYATGLAAAKASRGDEQLKKRVQFAWVDGGSLVSSIAMQPIEPPFVLVLNYSSYEYYLPQDAPDQITEASLLLWLRETVLSPDTVPLGGRSLLLRVRRLFYEVYTNIVQMFSTQPLLSCCLFGVPIAFLSMITYSLCMADFSVDRDEIYPDEDDDEERELLGESEDEEEEDSEGRGAGRGYDDDHQKND
ncbi:hypothetical protein PRIPAC_83499 [Pristionchus pacificus]|uniref:Thioredoxin domain-containing protein n=1 Tax=Pristionchus pacificus TaxID=54126 RepID=A0A8R1V853_PRIPA|nr:hypothetical protein PRIPAC_83499 [Pristionchus pacificus]